LETNYKKNWLDQHLIQ